MSEKENVIVKVSSSTGLSTGKDQEQKGKTVTQNESENDEGIQKTVQPETNLKYNEEVDLSGVVLVQNNETDSEDKPKKKKKGGGLEKNYKLDITELEMKDQTAMTERPEKKDQQDMTDDKQTVESLATSNKIFTPTKQVPLSLKKFKKRSSSADRFISEVDKVKPSPSQPIPTTEIEETVTELEDLDLGPARKSSVSLSRTASRVSSRMSRVSRTVRQLICCGVTMEVPSEDKIPCREGHPI